MPIYIYMLLHLCFLVDERSAVVHDATTIDKLLTVALVIVAIIVGQVTLTLTTLISKVQ